MPRSEGSKAPRRYGFACSACNRKKIRCDGDKPTCRRCRVRGETCTYKVAEHDPLLREQLQDAQDRIRDLEEQIKSMAGDRTPESVDEPPEPNAEQCSELSLDENGQNSAVVDQSKAIRMMKDIGLHLNPKRLNNPERLLPDEFEARKRLFLSAYVWDK
ncbi:hypothetical protein SLS54_006939 [Diplodia seriata]